MVPARIERRQSEPIPDERETYEALGRLVAAKRGELGLSVRDLANESGIGSGFIGDIENGRGNPTWNTLCSLAVGLRTNVVLLLAEAHVSRTNGDFHG